MTLRKSLIMSLAMHMLLFGAVLAFARYAGGVFRGGRGPIEITLFDGGGRKGTDDKQSKKLQRAPIKKTEQDLSPAIPGRQPEQAQSLEDPGVMQENAARSQTSEGTDNSNSATDSAPGQVAGSGSDSASSEQWVLIVSSIERVKSYPRMARERGIQGVVQVRFKLRPTGDVEAVEIVKSSGYDILDDASIRTVYRAAPLPYVNGWVAVPIAYVLK
jgi:protein TonB